MVLKNKNWILLFSLFLLLITRLAHADFCQNEHELAQVLKQVNLEFSTKDLLSCKINPDHPQQTIMAYAIQESIAENENIEDFQLYLMQVKHENKRVLSFYPVHEKLVSDAISLDSIQLDTAPYKINDSNRAVALRLHYSGHSQPNPFSMKVLNLYDLQNRKTVLEGLIVERYRAETDTHCNADVEERKSLLMMQKTQSKNYYDIQVRSQMDHYQYTGDRDNCKASKHTLSQQSFVLKFDGKHYLFPKQFKDEYQY